MSTATDPADPAEQDAQVRQQSDPGATTRSLAMTEKLEEFVAQTERAISEAESKYRGLQVLDLNDRQQIQAVTAGHKEVKKLLAAIESTRKELKEDALAWGRIVDKQAKRLKAPLEIVATRLKVERDKVEAEKERVKQLKQKQAQEQLQRRVNALAAVQGDTSQLAALATMSDDMFAAMLQKRTEAYQQEIEAKAWREEASEVSARLARCGVAATVDEVMATARECWPQWVADAQTEYDLAVAQREAQEREAAEQARKAEAERAELEAERDRLQEQTRQLEAERQRLEQEKAAAEEAERQRLEAEEQERALAEAAEIERQAEAERQERRAALLPDKQQLCMFADTVECFSIPAVLNKYAKELHEILFEAGHRIRDFADDLE